MRALELDYLARRRIAPWLLAAAALAIFADGGLRYRGAQRDIELKSARLAAVPGRAQEPTEAKTSAAMGEAQAVARNTIRRLAMPWDELFQALEASKTDHVALLAIEPDSEARTVSVSGEARDYLAALTYVAALGEQKSLDKVHLMRHEARQDGSGPVAFVVSASWGRAR